LNFQRLQEIHEATHNIPLVLHGGTGIPDAMVQKAISMGVSKVNVNTECQLVFAEATRKYIEAKKDQDTKAKGFDPRKLLKPGVEAIKNKCIEKFKVFGCLGKA
jgi:fructose-bisphosphate aldolase class II